jgi:hypothetical protein
LAAHIKSINSRTTIATIPEGFRPPFEVALKPDGTLLVIVCTDGSLQVDPPANGTFYTSITYNAKLGGVIRQLLSTLATAFVRKGVAVC